MFQKFAINKIIIIAISFIVLLLIYFFPSDEEYIIHSTLTYDEIITKPIYLLDNNNLV